jgi:hypothetical protein
MYTSLAEEYLAITLKAVQLFRVVSHLPKYTTSHPTVLLIVTLAVMIAPGLIATGLFCYIIQFAVYTLCSLDSAGSGLVPGWRFL